MQDDDRLEQDDADEADDMTESALSSESFRFRRNLFMFKAGGFWCLLLVLLLVLRGGAKLLGGLPLVLLVSSSSLLLLLLPVLLLMLLLALCGGVKLRGDLGTATVLELSPLPLTMLLLALRGGANVLGGLPPLPAPRSLLPAPRSLLPALTPAMALKLLFVLRGGVKLRCGLEAGASPTSSLLALEVLLDLVGGVKLRFGLATAASLLLLLTLLLARFGGVKLLDGFPSPVPRAAAAETSFPPSSFWSPAPCLSINRRLERIGDGGRGRNDLLIFLFLNRPYTARSSALPTAMPSSTSICVMAMETCRIRSSGGRLGFGRFLFFDGDLTCASSTSS
mmetsp:Transcript_16127/g.45160  ORF Transcript_16127/g.45160 Transcript_16127/m.45160 type:complete len:337 (+) Transcript_16127:191-1201(+)